MPNILWIQTDEHRPDSLGCYGSAWARTPNIDALAARGTAFRTAVCQSPVCVPSRASQLAARYPQELNTLHNDVGESELDGRSNEGPGDVFPPDTVTFPEVLEREAGYRTASIGKIHTPRHRTWQEVVPLVNDDRYSGYFGLNEAFDEQAHRVLKRPGATSVILAGTYPSAEDTPSRTITDQAIAWLREHGDSGRSFMLRASHNWPHTPVLPPPPFDEWYDPDDLPVRGFDEEAYRTRSAWDRATADLHRMCELTDEQTRQEWKDYMGLCAYVDHEVGRLLTALEELGLNEDTIVLFSADHGKALGEWGAGEKGFFDHEVWRVPFVWSWPGAVPQGVVRDDPCELIDTGRTLLALAGVESPVSWRGRDLFATDAPFFGGVFGQIGWPDAEAPIHRRQKPGTVEPWRESAFTDDHWKVMRMAVRTERYRLDEHWMRDGRRVAPDDADGNLFDLTEDPLERRNLWHDPAHAATLGALRSHLEDWFGSLDRPPATFG
jgi:choline-sulfatase